VRTLKFTVHVTVEAEGIQGADDWEALLTALEWAEPNRNPRGRWKDGKTWRATFTVDVRAQTVGRATKTAVDILSRTIDRIADSDSDLNQAAYVQRVRPVYVPGKDE
jgi:hypothetical protein